jgi:hypothetical protein
MCFQNIKLKKQKNDYTNITEYKNSQTDFDSL